tara:strand:+ start:9311 stop:11137 length:1827 start_codon:yes stop_codon:yes gene_type:complete
MATYGKISSSLLNFNSTSTAIDNPAGYSATERQTIAQRSGPNLNLGLFQSTPYVLTPLGEFSTNPIKTTSNRYAYGNNITLVTPNVKDSQPNNVITSMRVNRYEGSFMDKARGLHGSIIIGHDIGSVGFPNGTNENSASGYDTWGMDLYAPNIVIGSFILEGLGNQRLPSGYRAGSFGGNCIVGNQFYGSVVDANLDYVLKAGDYGSIQSARRNTVFGNGNYMYAFRQTNQTRGYAGVITDNTIVGHGNGNNSYYDNIGGYNVGGYKTQILPDRNNVCAFRGYRQANNTIVGTSNMSFQWEWNSGAAPIPGYSNMVEELGNTVIGRNNCDANIRDYNYVAGTRLDRSGYRVQIIDNTVVGSNNQMRTFMNSMSPGGYGTIDNVMIGRNNEFHNLASNNTIIGKNWLFKPNVFGAGNVSDADKNVFIGSADQNIFYGPTTGAFATFKNVFIGSDINSGAIGSHRHQNCIIIGADATASSNGVNNEITLGNSSIAALRCNVTTITALSDARDKTNIEPISNASAFIKDLKPVKFDWNRRDGFKSREHDMGFLAQDLDDAQNKHGIQEHLDIVYKSNPEALEASYGKLLPILVQALKEQQEEIEKLKSTTN